MTDILQHDYWSEYKAAEAEAAALRHQVAELNAAMGLANERLVLVVAERDAYRDLSNAIIRELGDDNLPKVLSVYSMRDARIGFYEHRKADGLRALYIENWGTG
jgi:hypothetical protein